MVPNKPNPEAARIAAETASRVAEVAKMDAAAREEVVIRHRAIEAELKAHRANHPAIGAQGWGRWRNRLAELVTERDKLQEQLRIIGNGGRAHAI